MPIRTKPGPAAGAVDAGVLNAPRSRKAERSARLSASPPQEQYAHALHRHLAGLPAPEIDFFINPRRVGMIARLIGHELKPGADILNVACGPFAIEFYLKPAGCRIEAFDREERLAALHKELTGRGLIDAGTFSVCDVNRYRSERLFDVVLINDVFYSRGLDFYELIGRYIARVKPGGLIYFDIQDMRAGPLWRLFGKDTNRRYDLARVAGALESAGLEIIAKEPALGIKGGLDGIVRRLLWRVAGLANSFVFVARKPD